MSTDFAISSQPKPDVEIKSSNYDRLNAALIACNVVAGFLLLVMLAIWCSPKVGYSRPIIIGPPDTIKLGEEQPALEELNVLQPGVQEFPETEVPQLAAMLDAVTEAVSKVKAFENFNGSDRTIGRGVGKSGFLDELPPGVFDVVPPHKRWKISYECPDRDVYAQQLSFFQIDLGVVHETKQDVQRIEDPSGDRTLIQTNRETINDSKQIFFVHQKQRMKQWDRQLCQQAGADLNHAFTVQFYPEATCELIRNVELAALAGTGRELKEVQHTKLKVVPDGGGFKFTVTGFVYR